MKNKHHRVRREPVKKIKYFLHVEEKLGKFSGFSFSPLFVFKKKKKTSDSNSSFLLPSFILNSSHHLCKGIAIQLIDVFTLALILRTLCGMLTSERRK